MARIDVDEATVLDRIATRLRSALGLSDKQCYLALSPNHLPRIPKGGEYFVAVSAMAGQFVEGEQIEGNITEEWGVAVTGYTRIQTDATDHAEDLLTNAARGLLVIKQRILAALVGQDTTTKDGNEFLRQLLCARNATAPEAGELTPGTMQIGMITVEFGVDFDWDLTGALPTED